MANSLPFLNLTLKGGATPSQRSAEIDQFFNGYLATWHFKDGFKEETPTDRLKKLATWCTIDPETWMAVDTENLPDYTDFNYLGANAVPGRNPPTYDQDGMQMTNVIIDANNEICRARYRRYKKLIAENKIQLERLMIANGYDETMLNDLKKQPEGQGSSTEEWMTFDTGRRRKAALEAARDEAMRRIMGLYQLYAYNETDYKGLEDPYGTDDNLGEPAVVDEEDRELVKELHKKDQKFQANNSQYGGAQTRVRAESKINEIKVFNPYEHLTELKSALMDLINTPGNDRLKDLVYSDIILFLTNGYKAVDVYRNWMLMGPSGVGKTTWARMLGRVYKASGIYMYGDVSITMANDYIGRYMGQSGPKTATKLNANLENILLIDEAYQITDAGGGEDGDYASEVIGTLVDYMDKNLGLLMIIVAGYEDRMKASFLGSNEGLDRRFPNKFVFPSYEANEMVNILEKKLNPSPKRAQSAKGGVSMAAPKTPTSSLGKEWDDTTDEKLTALIEFGRTAKAEVDRAKKQKEEDKKEGVSYSKSWEVEPEWAKEVAEIHDALFGKQGGSMENIAAKTNIYLGLPERKPARFGRTKYTYEHDMTVILQSLLDYEKYKVDLENERSLVVQYFVSPVANSGQRFYEWEKQFDL